LSIKKVKDSGPGLSKRAGYVLFLSLQLFRVVMVEYRRVWYISGSYGLLFFGGLVQNALLSLFVDAVVQVRRFSIRDATFNCVTDKTKDDSYW
jgi:hypothetical protein